ncbi:hypothetical protein K438DRAFT_1578301 [Mycena galopus ATCC 62051]|nr:hypothetical protein K438DRAFT_1578301 [Mycena galopus ATCC 62051]
MTIELPQELVDTILEYLQSDTSSLKACSLLSQAWVPRSRVYLFETLSLDPEIILDFRDLLRSPSCIFIPHVRTLKVYRPHRHQNDACFNEIAADVRRLNVTTLNMQLSCVVNTTNADAFFRTGLAAAFPNVTHLTLTCYFAPTPTRRLTTTPARVFTDTPRP